MSSHFPASDMIVADKLFSPKWNISIGLLGAALVVILVAGLITDRLYNPQVFNINKILLSGDASHVDRQVLKQTVIKLIDGNYFSLDSKKISQALHHLPWVETVRLRRQWPDTLLIYIEEHQPIALWGATRWLTTKGKLVQLPLPKNVLLPQLDGPEHLVETVWSKYQRWSTQFASHGLRMQSMLLSKQHLYTLEISYTTQRKNSNQGFEMMLAASNADKQLNTFLASYRQSMIAAPEQIKTVDLRYPSGFSISRYAANKLAQVSNN